MSQRFLLAEGLFSKVFVNAPHLQAHCQRACKTDPKPVILLLFQTGYY